MNTCEVAPCVPCLQAELAAARDDAEVHRIERRKVSEMLAVERAAREKAEAEAARLQSRVDALVRAVEEAPHDEDCPYVIHTGPVTRYGVAPCNCWKAAALAAGRRPEECYEMSMIDAALAQGGWWWGQGPNS